MNDKISVIVPVYNTGAFLKTCLDSLMNQTYSNYEVIVVNDGSTDDSVVIMNRYPNIRKIHQDNQGLSGARNTGLKHVSKDSKWIAFVDSDDAVTPNYLETMVTAAHKAQADMVQCKIKCFETDEQIIEDLKKTSHSSGLHKKGYKTSEEKFYLFKSNPTEGTIQMNKLFKKEILFNIVFPPGMVHEDEYVIYSELLNANKVLSIDDELYLYRVNRNGSITSKVKYSNITCLLSAREHRLELLKQNNDHSGFYEFTVRAELNDFMFMYWNWVHSSKTAITASEKETLLNLFRKIYCNNKSILTVKERTKYKLFMVAPSASRMALKR